MVHIRRRQLLLAGAVLAVTPGAATPQATKLRRVGVLTSIPKSDPETAERFTAFTQGLKALGWREGGNLRIDYRYAEGDAGRMPKLAKELLDLRPDVLLASGTQAATTFRQQTLSVPIVFIQVSDPVALGLVTNLARPEGNITGIINFNSSIAAKWLQILKECAPGVKRIALVFDPGNPSWPAYVRAVETSAPKFNVQLTPASVRDGTELKEAVTSFAKQTDGALIVLPSPFATTHRDLLVSLAAQHRLPVIYPYSYFTTSGGLMSYGIDTVNAHRQAASYVAQILKGTKPAELPVQQPTKLELVINLKTAKTLGIKIPQSILALADRVIDL
jgi:putative ABC transport system substrate-binding protein